MIENPPTDIQAVQRFNIRNRLNEIANLKANLPKMIESLKADFVSEGAKEAFGDGYADIEALVNAL